MLFTFHRTSRVVLASLTYYGYLEFVPLAVPLKLERPSRPFRTNPVIVPLRDPWVECR